jgi:hypothetical protein
LSQAQSDGYLLKFISGKYQGGEFPLEMGDEIEIGRSSELDMVLVEDMVSRRHARISAGGGDVRIEDFGSTNGTFVNGKKIEQAKLEKGDRILIGTSIIKLVERDERVDEPRGLETETAAQEEGATEPEPTSRAAASSIASGESPDTRTGARNGVGSRPQTPSDEVSGAPGIGEGGATHTGSISGLIQEVPLPDILQLFSSSRKSGVLVVNSSDLGKVYLEDGRVYYATINDDPDISPYKAFYRMLAWDEGTFSLERLEDKKDFEDEIDESIENLLMEGMKQLDEIRNLGDDVPDFQDELEVDKPLVPPLRNLSDELLDTLQLVYNFETVSTVLNKSLASDLETMEDIVHLRRNDYISVISSDDDSDTNQPGSE